MVGTQLRGSRTVETWVFRLVVITWLWPCSWVRRVLRYAGVPEVPLVFGYGNYRADGEDGIPSGCRLCRSCLICRPEAEFHDPVMCDKVVMLNFSVAVPIVKLYHTKGFLSRSRRLEQLHGSSSQPVTREDRVRARHVGGPDGDGVLALEGGFEAVA